MRFTKTFGVIRHKTKDDWFDLVLDQDTPLYVDPFLVFDDKDPFWASARDDVVEFFNAAAALIAEAYGNKNSPAYRKALRLLTFPEPKEFALGVAMGSPNGAGTGEKFAREMAAMLDLIRQHGSVASLASIAGFTLFCDGLGLDRMSDILCNILKEKFIVYTQDIAKARGVRMKKVDVKHASWDGKHLRWIDTKVLLPESSVTSGGVLLTPERFLKDIPRVTSEGFWAWAETNVAQELRDDLNYDLSKDLSLTQKRAAARDLARRRPKLVVRYVRKIEDSVLLPYDVEADPRRLVQWREAGEAAALGLMKPEDAPEKAEDFSAFVVRLATDFQHQVENTDLWTALWYVDKSKHVHESQVQAIAGAMWTIECRVADVDLSQEVRVPERSVGRAVTCGFAAV
jgi:hypothetical protein